MTGLGNIKNYQEIWAEIEIYFTTIIHIKEKCFKFIFFFETVNEDKKTLNPNRWTEWKKNEWKFWAENFWLHNNKEFQVEFFNGFRVTFKFQILLKFLSLLKHLNSGRFNWYLKLGNLPEAVTNHGKNNH